jgi:NAD(P)-dependent dehydrogenase (short-subunit alcohol dehydrogenase family)
VPQVAIVTGGSSGIGAATARRLTEQGWSCVLISRGEERVRAVADELGSEWETCDVGDLDAVEQIAAAICERHPQIGLLVNNAGIPGRGGFVRASAEAIEEVTRTNYLGAVWCLRAFLPALEAGAPSDVVNVVSVAGTVATGAAGPYTASKHAQLAFSRAVSAQLRPRGIRVHTVLPGFAPTSGFPEPSVLPKALEWTVIDAERIARTIVNSIAHDKRESFVPWWFRSMAVLQGSAPSLFSRGLTWFSGRFAR